MPSLMKSDDELKREKMNKPVYSEYLKLIVGRAASREVEDALAKARNNLVRLTPPALDQLQLAVAHECAHRLPRRMGLLLPSACQISDLRPAVPRARVTRQARERRAEDGPNELLIVLLDGEHPARVRVRVRNDEDVEQRRLHVRHDVEVRIRVSTVICFCCDLALSLATNFLDLDKMSHAMRD